MGSGGSSQQSQKPGTLSPVTAYLQDLFGGGVQASGGQWVPTSFGQGGAFSPEMFSALPGLLTNMPMSGAEQTLTGGNYQNAILNAGQQSQGFMGQAAGALPALLETNPAASIAAARRGFTEETLPAILEKAPGFGSSDLQRELMRSGVDLETNIAALKEANLGRVGNVVSGMPAFAQAFAQNPVDVATNALGYGQFAREFAREVSPAGDAFRVLSQIQSLLGPGLTTSGKGSSKNASVL